MLHSAQKLAISHRTQLSEAGQATHPTPLVLLQVFPVAQHPRAVLGRRKKLVLHMEHVLAELHLLQFKVDEQVTQPIPAV